MSGPELTTPSPPNQWMSCFFLFGLALQGQGRRIRNPGMGHCLMCVFLLGQNSVQAGLRLSTQPLGTQLIFVIWLSIVDVTRLNRKAVVLCQFPEGSQRSQVSCTFHLLAVPAAPHLPMNFTPKIFKSICKSCWCYLVPHKKRSVCLLCPPGLWPSPSLFFFAGCG